jgi:hypothetical protein
MPDGSVKYVHAMARVARDPSGGIEFFGAVTDVTAATEAERKLRRSEAYLAESQHLSHTSSWAWDVRRREFVYRSVGVYDIFGLDPSDALSILLVSTARNDFCFSSRKPKLSQIGIIRAASCPSASFHLCEQTHRVRECLFDGRRRRANQRDMRTRGAL